MSNGAIPNLPPPMSFQAGLLQQSLLFRIIKLKHVAFAGCQKLLFSRFQAFAVTVSGLASGESGNWVPNPAMAGPTSLEN